MRRFLCLVTLLFIANSLSATTPALRCQIQADSVVVSWPLTGQTYGLETTADLASDDWSTVVATPTEDDGILSVTLPLDPLARFFRLRWVDGEAPVVRIVINPDDVDLKEYFMGYPESPACHDVTGDGCMPLNVLDAQMPHVFVADDTTLPGTDGSSLSYQWEVFFPVNVFQGAEYPDTPKMVGVNDSTFMLQPNALFDIGPIDAYRVVLTITDNAGPTPRTTIVRFRFIYINSTAPMPEF